jgi:hypothetical protein
MKNEFWQVSDTVHAQACHDHSTKVIVCKEWIGMHALRSFTESEWADVTEKLRGQRFIIPDKDAR